MSRLSFVIGLAVSLGLHSLLFVNVWGQGKRQAVVAEPPKTAKLIMPPPPEPKQPEPRQEEPKVEPHKEEVMEPPVQAAAKPLESPDQVVKATSPVDVGQDPGDHAESASGDVLPELRLTWDNSDELLTVARAMGFRILLINPKNQPIGELSLQNGITVKRFTRDLSGYSNRVRTLPPDFFGNRVVQQVNEPIRCLWILVPSAVDIHWVSAQKQAVEVQGLQNSQVSHFQAKIVATGNGYDLKSVEVVTL